MLTVVIRTATPIFSARALRRSVRMDGNSIDNDLQEVLDLESPKCHWLSYVNKVMIERRPAYLRITKKNAKLLNISHGSNRRYNGHESTHLGGISPHK